MTKQTEDRSDSARPELRQYVQVVRRRWWLIASALVATVGVALAFTIRQTPIYEAEARLFVGQRTISGNEVQFAQNLTQTSLALVKSYSEAIRTRPIVQSVIDELKLPDTPDEMIERLSASPVTDTQIIRIGYQDRDPVAAQVITNKIAISFIESLDRFDPSEAGQSASQVNVLEPAVKPKDPVSPKPLFNVAAGLLGGSLLALGAVMLAERIDSTIKTRDETERASGRPVLAIVPHVETPKGLIVNAQGTPAGEAYRALRSAIQHASEDRRIRTLAVTSPEAGDGKTSTSFNLAAAFAEGGVQSYLVEADMRKPSLGMNLNYAPGKGLANLLTSDEIVDNVLYRSPFAFMHVIPAGQESKDAGELLLRPRFKEVIDMLAEHARLVIVDTPPILAVSDAASLAKQVDAFLLVVRAGKTKEEQLREAMRILNGAGAEVVGVVVNDLDRSQALGYGYGYGYGNQESYGPAKLAPDLTHRAPAPMPRGADEHSSSGRSKRKQKQKVSDEAPPDLESKIPDEPPPDVASAEGRDEPSKSGERVEDEVLE